MIEFKEFIEKVRQARLGGFPFVMYRKPDESTIYSLIQKDQRLELVNTFEQSGFIMAPFKKSDHAVLISRNNAFLNSCEYRSSLKAASSNVPLSTAAEPDDGIKEAHLNLVKKGKKFITDDGALKVVLSRKEVVPLNDFDPQVVFEKLLEKYASAFVYIWFHPQIGLWAGASPETLVKTQGPLFRTMALAGTKKFQGRTDIVWDNKELTEQQLVTDHIVEALKGSNFEVGHTFTKKAGNLLHICTEIAGTLDADDSITDLIEKLHPTAAVCGFPKREAENFILNQEGYERSFYTGFLGELNLELEADLSRNSERKPRLASNLFVNLRCMQIIDEAGVKACLYIGGGITEASKPVSEWEETVEKSLVMKSVL